MSKPPGRPAFGHDLVPRGPLLPDEPLGAVDEVVEGVLLHEHAVLMPSLAHLIAAEDVRHRIHKAAVRERDVDGREVGILAEPVAAIAADIERRRPIADKVLF
jgi:hypothetical protein